MILLTKLNKPHKAEGAEWTDAEAVAGFDLDRLSADRMAMICVVKNKRMVRCWMVPYNAESDLLRDWTAQINRTLIRARRVCAA